METIHEAKLKLQPPGINGSLPFTRDETRDPPFQTRAPLLYDVANAMEGAGVAVLLERRLERGRRLSGGGADGRERRVLHGGCNTGNISTIKITENSATSP